MVRKVASFIGRGMFGCGIISRGSRTPVEDQTSIMQRVHHTVLDVRCGVFEHFRCKLQTSCVYFLFHTIRSMAIREIKELGNTACN
jgi:hypothetical protein